jgi:ferrous iron transport protein B
MAAEPVMRPLGIPWEGSVALVAGVGAKEITVSTLGVLYAADGETGDAESGSVGESGSGDGSGSVGESAEVSLPDQMVAPDPATGLPDWTPAAALAFMIFALLYFPCLAALAAIRKETGGWRWVILSVVYNTLAAWVVAWLAYTLANFLM